MWIDRLVLSPRPVRSCPRMILRTRPPGHRPHSFSSVKSMPQSQADAGSRGGHSSEDGFSQQQEADPLFLPQLNNLIENYIVRGEDVSNIDVTIPPQCRGSPTRCPNTGSRFRSPADLPTVSRHTEQLRLQTAAHRRHDRRLDRRHGRRLFFNVTDL